VAVYTSLHHQPESGNPPHSPDDGAQSRDAAARRTALESGGARQIPHTIILEPGLVVFKIYNGYWFLGCPTLEELRQDFRAVTRKCRPDWDITDAEHKAAWSRREKDGFYPYGKSYATVFGEQD